MKPSHTVIYYILSSRTQWLGIAYEFFDDYVTAESRYKDLERQPFDYAMVALRPLHSNDELMLKKSPSNSQLYEN